MKAFRSTIDDFEGHSIASTQSIQSMRNAVATYRAGDPNGTRAAVAQLMQRTGSPQPYPYYHHRQSRTPSPNPPASPQAVVVENGRHSHGGGGGGYWPTATADKVEKVPLVQHITGTTTVNSARNMGKSMSLDRPVAIAHL